MGTCVWGFKKWIGRWILGRLLCLGGEPSRRLAKKPRVWDAIARPKRSNRKVGSQCGSNNTQLRHFSQCAFGTDLQIAMSKELLLVLEGFPLHFGIQLQRQKLFGPNKTKLSCLALSFISFSLSLSLRYLGFHSHLIRLLCLKCSFSTDISWIFIYASPSQKIKNNKIRTKFDYKPICNRFATTHYVAAYKTIHIYYLKKLHNLGHMTEVNVDGLISYHVAGCSKLVTNQFVIKL